MHDKNYPEPYRRQHNNMLSSQCNSIISVHCIRAMKHLGPDIQKAKSVCLQAQFCVCCLKWEELCLYLTNLALIRYH